MALKELSAKGVSDWDAVQFLKKKIPEAHYNRRAFDRTWYRNALFFSGLQWVRFNRTAQQWRPIAVPDWFPKQVTNKFAVNVDIMKSVFLQSDPQQVFQPASAELEDVAAARAAKDISKAIDLEVDQDPLESFAATWLAITGNAWVIDSYDNDPLHGTKFIPDLACIQCMKVFPADQWNGGCPHCHGQNIVPARDERGEMMGQDVPIGRMFSEVASPLEMHYDMVAGSFYKSPYWFRARTYPVEVLKEMFPDQADEIKADDAGVDSGAFYQTALAYVTNAASSSPGNYGGSVGSIDQVPRATLYHLHVEPSSKMPEGGEALICGNTRLWRSAIPYHDDKGNPINTATHMTFNQVPGRVPGKSPADDLIFKQIQRNKIEALIQLHMERNANGTWLLPKGIGIDSISGEPGEKIWYNGFLNGLKPERLTGAELPGAVFRWMDALDKDMQDIAHTYDVLKGETPKGFPTLGGAQLLLERGYAGYSDALKSWGRGWTRVRRNRLSIWKEFASDERTMMVLGPNQKWEAKHFSKSNLAGRIEVYLEEASIQPKSKAYQQLVTSQLIEAQLVDMQDPSVRSNVMNLFDAPELVEGVDVDLKDAVKEREEFAETGRVRPRAGIDNDSIHAAQHIKDCKSDAFWSWPPQQQQAWVQHALYHVQAVQKAQEQQAQMDPHIMNARARLEQIAMELQAFTQQKNVELEHMQKRKAMDLQAHGYKKGLDASVEQARAATKIKQEQVKRSLAAVTGPKEQK